MGCEANSVTGFNLRKKLIKLDFNSIKSNIAELFFWSTCLSCVMYESRIFLMSHERVCFCQHAMQ